MKTTSAAILLLAALPALAQTKTAPHRAASSGAKKPATPAAMSASKTGACDADLPTLGEAIPKVTGCPKILYALRYLDTKVGDGPLAVPFKLYTVNYTGYFPSGEKFDSSVDRNDPIIFPAGAHQVIAGWDTGFEGMHVGGKRRLFIPYQLAYGETGRPPKMPGKAMLVFDVELLAQSDIPQQQQPGQAPPQNRPATPPTTTNPDAAKPATPAPDAAKPATPATDPTKPTAVPPTNVPPTTTSPKP